jgi:hypothetical protein
MNDKFCIIGNSHVSQFNYKMNTIYGYGASICGLWNDNSVTKLKEKILVYQKENPKKTLIFFLGQSDVEFIYYFKSVKQNKKIDIEEFISNLINSYILFIKKFISNKVIILGINPHVITNINHIYKVNFKEKSLNNPTGENNSEKYKFENYKHIYNDSYEKRFDNHIHFNEKLKKECDTNNVNYVSINDIILDKNNKVKPKYMPKIIDHHLVKNIDLYYHLLEKIKSFII